MALRDGAEASPERMSLSKATRGMFAGVAFV
jgi:hypothetical protein